MNITIPEGTKRIVLISNIKNPPSFSFEVGDLVIELNRAVHHESLMKALKDAPINKFLVVRHNKNGHFFPDNFVEKSSTWDNIVLTSNNFGFSKEDWFKRYFIKTQGKTPTTGFAIYQHFRNRRPRIPIIGLGFSLDDHSTPHNSMHDWDYEFNEYKKDKNFKAII